MGQVADIDEGLVQGVVGSDLDSATWMIDKDYLAAFKRERM